jgi:hypothetical protein
VNIPDELLVHIFSAEKGEARVVAASMQAGGALVGSDPALIILCNPLACQDMLKAIEQAAASTEVEADKTSWRKLHETLIVSIGAVIQPPKPHLVLADSTPMMS